MERDRASPGPLIAIALGIGAATVLVLFGGGPSTTGDPDPDIPRPSTTMPRDESASALGVVEEFSVALGVADIEGALASMGDEVRSLDMPGFPRLGAPTDAVSVRERLTVLSIVADLSLGRCHADTPQISVGVDWIVTCPDAAFSGPFLTALAESQVPGVWFSVEDGKIVAIGDHAGYRSMDSHLCRWADGLVAVTGAFDLACRPRFGVEWADGALDLASQSWLDRGSPQADIADLRNRLQLTVVEHFLAGLDGDRSVAADLVAADFDPASAPGFLGASGPLPSPAAYVRWFGGLFNVIGYEGACVPLSGSATAVRCHDVLWSGPVVDAAGLAPVAVDLDFEVRDGLVTSIGGDVPPSIRTWFRSFCSWIEVQRPAVARFVLMPGCVPVYTGWSGDAFAQLAPVFAGAN